MESLPSQIAHFATLGGVIGILGVLLNQHKVFVRMKDRINTLWADRCRVKKEIYIPLEGNGKH